MPPVAAAPTEVDQRKKTLGSWAVPRHANRVPADRVLKLETLFRNVGIEDEWKWTKNAAIRTNYALYEEHEPVLAMTTNKATPKFVTESAAMVVTMDTTGACTPAVLSMFNVGHSSLAETQVWTLRFRMPRSVWEDLNPPPPSPENQVPGVLSRLLDVPTSKDILHRLAPLMPVTESAVLHPHLVSILVGSCDGVQIPTTGANAQPHPFAGEARARKLPDVEWNGRLLLVAVPPRSRDLEECFTLLTHSSVWAEIDAEDSDADTGVPLSHVIQHPERWGTDCRYASSSALASAFNDTVAQTLQWDFCRHDCTQTEFATLGGLTRAVISRLMPYPGDETNACRLPLKDGIEVCASLLERYCGARLDRSEPVEEATAAPAPARSKPKPKPKQRPPANAATVPAAKPTPKRRAPPPPPPPPPPSASGRAGTTMREPNGMDPSSEDEEDEATRTASFVPPAAAQTGRKRSAEGAKLSTANSGAAKKKKKKKKNAKGRGSEDSSDDDENDRLSSSSSVSNASEEEDDSSSQEEEEDADDEADEEAEEEDEDDNEDEDEDEDEPNTTNRPSHAKGGNARAPEQPEAAPKFSDAATYQLPSHAADAQRFWNIIETNGSAFSAACAIAVASDCKPLMNETPATDVFKAAAYNRLLGHALGCLEDVLEERRPDQCVLLPKTEASAARNAAKRAVDLCDHTLPQLDDAIAKLEALRQKARTTLLGIVDDLPALGDAAAAAAANGHAPAAKAAASTATSNGHP